MNGKKNLQSMYYRKKILKIFRTNIHNVKFVIVMDVQNLILLIKINSQIKKICHG